MARFRQYRAVVEPVPVVAGSGTGDVLFAACSIIIPIVASFQYQAIADPVPVVAAETVTVDKWYQPLALPNERPVRAQVQSLAFVPLSGPTVEQWQQPLSIPKTRSAQPRGQDLALVWSPTVPSIEQWQQPLSQPQKGAFRNPAQGATFVAQVTAEVPGTGTEYNWFRHLSQPIHVPPRLIDAQSVVATAPTVTPQQSGNNDVLFSTTSIIVPQQTSFQYQSLAQPVLVPSGEVPGTGTEYNWFLPLSQPRISVRVNQVQAVFVPQVTAQVPGSGTEYNWFLPLSEPIKRTPLVRRETGAWSTFTPPVETIKVDSWFQHLSRPISDGYEVVDSIVSFSFTGDVGIGTEYNWFRSLSEPQKPRRLTAPYLPALSWNTETPPAGPQVPGNNDVLFVSTQIIVPWQSSFQYQALVEPVFVAPQVPGTGTEYNWFLSLSDPVRPKPWLKTAQQQFLAWSGFTPPQLPGTGTEYNWFLSLSQPVLAKPWLSADQQQSLAWSTFTPAVEIITIDKWFRPLSEPVHPKPWISATQQQFLAWNSTEIVTLDKWYRPLIEPVRPTPWLKVHQQQFLAWSWTPEERPGTGTQFNWFAQLSAPLHLPRPLPVQVQQFFAFSFPFQVPGPNNVLMSTWFVSLSTPVKAKFLDAAHQINVNTDQSIFPPPPPPAAGEFTVSGQTVQDLFTHDGVTYTFAPVTRRTN